MKTPKVLSSLKKKRQESKIKRQKDKREQCVEGRTSMHAVHVLQLRDEVVVKRAPLPVLFLHKAT